MLNQADFKFSVQVGGVEIARTVDRRPTLALAHNHADDHGVNVEVFERIGGVWKREWTMRPGGPR